MADIQQNNSGKGRSRLRSPRVDLTPMVDLGFLLITFFVFTSTLTDKKKLDIFMPMDGTETPIPQSGAVTLLPDDDKIWYYQGDMPTDKSGMQAISYGNKDELRQKLIHLKQSLIAANGNDEKLMVLIKPTANADFGKVVDMLDEMLICSVKRYSIIDINQQEEKLIE